MCKDYDKTILRILQVWKRLPESSFVQVGYKLEGLKEEKVRMTIGLCSNADGSEKLKQIII